MKHFLIVILLINCFISCDFPRIDKSKVFTKHDSLLIKKKQIIEKFKNVKFKSIFGDRLFVIGDFNGDKRTDTLKECYVSKLTGKEIFKEYEILNLDSNLTADEDMYLMDSLIGIYCTQQPDVLVKSTNSKIETLTLPYCCQSTGISYLINVGDLNGDKKDDIAILRSYIRFAGMTSDCYIYSYKDNKWKTIFGFTVYGPEFDMDNEVDIKKSKIKTEIPGFLEKKKGVWYYFDYKWETQGFDTIEETGKMKVLKLKK